MRAILPEKLIALANQHSVPLYVVGGSVRDYLAGITPLSPYKRDWDICSPASADEFVRVASQLGFIVKSVYKNTGTVKLSDTDGIDYEYSCFRSDKYVRGTHVPVEIFFTNDIRLDAKRRDFTANAVYYDIAADQFVDPLDGVSAIKEKRLTTVDCAEKVFGEDGLRLMRLARQTAQLGFYPDEECLLGAQKNAILIRDITPERIFTELMAILAADEKYGNQGGAYNGLKLLDKTNVLHYIIPELVLGKGMQQRADFHNHDVLEHSFRAVKYADPKIRLAALFHDVAKAYCSICDGNSYEHPITGERMTKEILTRLKAPKQLTDNVCALVRWHMYDMDCKTKENKLRRFFITHYDLLEELLFLKKAHFSACKDDLSIAPTCLRWRELLVKMQAENVPFSVKQMAVSGKDIIDAGVTPCHTSQVLNALLLHLAITPTDNKKDRLIFLALSFEKQLIKP